MKHNKIIATVLTATALLSTPSISSFADIELPSVFSKSALTAEAATEYIYKGLVYSIDTTNKTATLTGRYSNLSTITVPGTVTYNNVTYKVKTIQSKAFSGGASIREVDMTNASYLTTIGSEAFASTGIHTVKLAPSVTTISSKAFYNCQNLRTFNFNGNNKISTISSSTFQKCIILQTITLPSSIKTIDRYAFKESGLTNITIPENVTNIYDYAFHKCKELKNITFKSSGSSTPKLSLRAHSFGACTALEKVSFLRTGYTTVANVFADSNPNLIMVGYGAKDYTAALCKYLVNSWGLSYKPTDSSEKKFQTVKALSQKINEHIRPADVTDEGCAAKVLSLGKGTCGGYARAFYNCALAMGMSKQDVLVGGDAHCHAWNFVKLDGIWFVVDAGHAKHIVTDSEYYNYIKDWDGGGVSQHQIRNWIICVDNQTGASDETDFENPRTVNFNTYLRDYYIDGVHLSGIRSALGDVSCDGVVNAIDLTILKQYIIKSRQFNAAQVKLGDFNCNGVTDLADAAALQQWLIKS